MHWTDTYLKKKWKEDCWTLASNILHDQRSLMVPAYAIPSDLSSPKENSQRIGEGLKEWKRLANPKELCLVAMSKSKKFIHHVGIYSEADDGVIIHSELSNGVKINSLRELRTLGWKRIEFYDYICPSK